MTEIGASFAWTLIGLIGDEARRVADLGQQVREIERDSPAPERDIKEWEQHAEVGIVSDTTIPETERTALVSARRGQGLFRDNVRKVERACRITKVERMEHLIASHIQPWRDSNNEQRLDGENGPLLTQTVDHLFDKGFISFEDSGRLIISPVADPTSLSRMGINQNALTSRCTTAIASRRRPTKRRASPNIWWRCDWGWEPGQTRPALRETWMKHKLQWTLLALLAGLGLSLASPALAGDRQRWEEAQRLDTIEAYYAYLAAGGSAKRLMAARQRLRQLRYQKTLQDRTLAAYDSFINEFSWAPEAEMLRSQRPALEKELAAQRAAEEKRKQDEAAFAGFTGDRSINTAADYLRKSPEGAHRTEVLDWLGQQRGWVAVPGTSLYLTLRGDRTLPGIQMNTGIATWQASGMQPEMKKLVPRAGQRLVVLQFGFITVDKPVGVPYAALAVVDRTGALHRGLGWSMNDQYTGIGSLNVVDRMAGGPLVFLLPNGKLDDMTLAVDGKPLATLGSLRAQ